MFPRTAHAPMPFYRSHVSRAAFVLTGAYLAWSFVWGPPQWRDTPSLRWLYDHWLPAPLITAAAVAYVLLHIVGTPLAVMVGCGLGMVLYGWELFALCVTLDVHRPANPLAIAAVFVALVMHYACLRLVLIQQADAAQAVTDRGRAE